MEPCHISTQFSLAATSLVHSWQWLCSGFQEEYRRLRQMPALLQESPEHIIWDTRQKFVMRLQIPGGREVAYKTYRTMHASRYFFRLSPLANEAATYQQFLLLGLPMAKVLAVGETRHCFVIKTGFMVTEFLADTSDGGRFLAHGDLAQETALRDELIHRNLRYLALLHDNGYLHRGLTPYNFLWRKRAEPDAQGHLCDLFWIDVATCHKLPRFLLKRMLIKDFVKFFHFYEFSRDELKNYLQSYFEAVKRPLLSPDDLLDRLIDAIARRQQRRHHHQR